MYTVKPRCNRECAMSPTFRSTSTPSRYSRSGEYEVVKYSCSETNVPAGAQIPAVLKGASDLTKRRLATHADLITANARLSKIEASEDAVANAAQVVVGESVVLLPL